MTWRVAIALDVLLDEINAASPWRNKVADGSIGDAAHASRSSDHNPWIERDGQGIVRARDFTHDPLNGVDCDVLAERVRLLGKAGQHPALGPGAYVIWEGRIASDTEDGDPWDWEPYSGSNAHTAHMHVSVATSAIGFDSSQPWGITLEDDMFNDNDRALLKANNRKLDRLIAKATNSGERERATTALLRKLRGEIADVATVREVDVLLAKYEDQ